MRLGMSTAAYYGRLETEEAAALCATMAVDCCEVFLETHSEYTAEFGHTVRSALPGFPVHSVHPKGTQFEGDLFGKSPRQRSDALRIWEGVLAAGQAMGAKVYVYHGPTDFSRQGQGPNLVAQQGVLVELCAMAAQRGICIGWENVVWAGLNTPEHVACIRHALPDMGFVLDIKQAMRCGVDALILLEAMGDRLVNVHLCDWDAQGKLCLPGQGVFDFSAFFSALRRGGYEGPAILEPYPYLFDKQEELETSLAYLRACAKAE